LRHRRQLTATFGLLVLAAALSGCSTANQAANAASATSAAIQATGNAISSLVSPPPTQGAVAQRAQMEKQAGPAHFANPQFIAGHEHLKATHTPFEERRSKFVSSTFVASREQFRGGKALPNQGPVLGAAVGDSAASLAALAAAPAGVPLPMMQPFLAQLLPGFGY
jgi:hypothetical protein